MENLHEYKNKMSELASEHPMLLRYFKLHDQIRIHMINCDPCNKMQGCHGGAQLRGEILKLHKELNEHFSLKERANGS